MADLKLLGEIWRILKPNGILLIGDVPNKYSFFKFLFKKLRTLPKGYSDREVCNLLCHSGFQMVKKWRSTLLPARVRRISPVLEIITSRICNIYLLIDGLLSRTFLGVMSTNMHYVFEKTLKTSPPISEKSHQ